MMHIDIRREGLLVYRMLLLAACSNVVLALAGMLLPSATFLLGAVVIVDLGSIVLILGARFRLAERFVVGDAAIKEAIQIASRDELTGARTRQAFLNELASSVHHGSRAVVSLLLMDVDHFKAINDGFGHGVGDAVLKHFVDVASDAFPSASINRLGGDEFAVLFSGDRAQAERSAALFLSRLRLPVMIAGRQVSVSTSIGIATSPDHSVFSDELILCADLALYESKRRGRGTFTVFDETMMADQKYRRFIERELRAAILLDELDLHYQPILDGSGEIVGVEALVRWCHPIRGYLSPADFIGIAEQSTLIDLIGEWVFRRACRDASLLPGRWIGINVSAAQLKRDAFVHMVTTVLAEAGRPAGLFTFEITESVALTASAAVLARLEALRGMGSRISLDDFGTGHFGFSSLNALPFDSIKVDRSYVQAMGADETANILVAALCAIGRARNISVVAEGIETEEQLALAKAAGCTVFQGYLFGRPVALADVVKPRNRSAAERAS